MSWRVRAKDISAAERFSYRYRESELAEWAPRLRELAASTSETHALMNNCFRDYGVDNARQLATMLGETAAPPRGNWDA